ncbi:hypothetical protein KR51_00031480 [Rubidibacter lacunae KORDI 51-2]|uniref:Bacterial Pleckstrin homology domain-containing protein n=1 Tax=Rubidibacter lacunae KORDI 51-2 TaxID=582515 RepID=U5DHX4_9CHRO|nr:hypothetical protein [Rubidibacter lacunae]ERN40209.1 hypothetical protein KR51_00031480 [Rubidibacter lacunae KORDI 51-2]
MPETTPNATIFRLSPIVRITLLCLYVGLTVPLPFLATATDAPIPASGLWIAIAIGLVALYGALCERVVVDAECIKVTYPRWIPPFFRSGWSLAWSDIADLKMRTTGQGGLVYYFVTRNGDRAYLLPMRVGGFTRLVENVSARTGLDMRDVRPLAQPWMYLVLFAFALLLFLIDVWTIWTAIALGRA